MAKILDLEAFAQSERIPTLYIDSLAVDLIREGKADGLVSGKLLVKFNDIEFDAVKVSLSNDNRLPDLAGMTSLAQEVARELVLRYKELHPEVLQENIDRLLNEKAATIRIALEPKTTTTDYLVNQIVEVGVRIISDREIRNVQIDIETSPGLSVIARPSNVDLIPPSDEGYVDLVTLRTINYGPQTLKTMVSGILRGSSSVEESSQITLFVHSQPPQLQAKLGDYPPQIFYGDHLTVPIQATNSGSGTAKEIVIVGLDRVQSQLVITRTVGKDLEIQPGSSVNLQITLLAAKSGTVKAENLRLDYKDLEGRPYSTSLGSLELDISSPQPSLKIVFSPQPFVSNQALTPPSSNPSEIHMEYVLKNEGPGIAKNIRSRIIVNEGITLVRGILSQLVPVMEKGATRSGQFDARNSSPSDTSGQFIVDRVEIDYADSEDVPHNIVLSGDILLPAQQENLTSSTIQSTAASEVRGVSSSAPSVAAVPAIAGTPSSQIDNSKLSSQPQQPQPAPPTPSQAKVDLAPLLESGTTEKWLKILESSQDVELDLSKYLVNEENYHEDGYRNLLVAIFDTNISKKQLVSELSDDKFTFRMIEFLRALREKGQIEYDTGSSDIQNADQALKILSPEDNEASQTTAKKSLLSRKQPTFKPKKYSFANSNNETITIKREIELSEDSGRPQSIHYTIVKT